jgi:hypothetical protein
MVAWGNRLRSHFGIVWCISPTPSLVFGPYGCGYS